MSNARDAHINQSLCATHAAPDTSQSDRQTYHTPHGRPGLWSYVTGCRCGGDLTTATQPHDTDKMTNTDCDVVKSLLLTLYLHSPGGSTALHSCCIHARSVPAVSSTVRPWR